MLFHKKDSITSFYPYSQKGFTLSETLITLVIIGVVAALTVPSMIANYQKEQTITKLKKVFSALSQTTARAIADNGPIRSWSFGEDVTAETTREFMDTYVIPYLSLMKSNVTTADDNWDKTINYLNGNTFTYSSNYIRYYLNDGTSITATMLANNETTVRFKILVDLNGDKKPNKVSKDIFSFFYYLYSTEYPNVNGRFVPDGFWRPKEELASSANPYACCKDKTGDHCAAYIITNDWEFPDDYPW